MRRIPRFQPPLRVPRASGTRSIAASRPARPARPALPSRSTSATATQTPPGLVRTFYRGEPESFAVVPPRTKAPDPNDENFDINSDPDDEDFDKAPYVRAETADELTWVGGLERWWDNEEHWPRHMDFDGFKPMPRTVDASLLELAVKRAVVEVLVLHASGENLVRGLPHGDEAQFWQAARMRVEVKDGNVSVTGPTKSSVADMLSNLQREPSEPEGSRNRYMPSPAEVEDCMSSEEWTEDFKQVPLTSPEIKFAVLKRLFQLTGRLVPDAKLPTVNKVDDVLGILRAPIKAPTLSQEVTKNEAVTQLPNVTVAAKRVTRGDRDMKLGRFKLIEEQLNLRGLPERPQEVIKGKEGHFMTGGA